MLLLPRGLPGRPAWLVGVHSPESRWRVVLGMLPIGLGFEEAERKTQWVAQQIAVPGLCVLGRWAAEDDPSRAASCVRAWVDAGELRAMGEDGQEIAVVTYDARQRYWHSGVDDEAPDTQLAAAVECANRAAEVQAALQGRESDRPAPRSTLDPLPKTAHEQQEQQRSRAPSKSLLGRLLVFLAALASAETGPAPLLRTYLALVDSCCGRLERLAAASVDGGGGAAACPARRRIRRAEAAASLALDSALGAAAAVLLLHYPPGRGLLAACLAPFSVASEGAVSAHVEWLMGAPAGFKLNADLSRTLGGIFLSLLRACTLAREALSGSLPQPWLPPPALSAALGAATGASGLLAIASDAARLYGVPTAAAYAFVRRLYAAQLGLLAGLWRLFRGKKWNPLRRRVDSARPGLDAVLLGAVVFTVVSFTVPTTLAYYLSFALLHVALGAARCALSAAARAAAAVPLLRLVSLIVWPALYPGGLRLALSPSGAHAPCRLACALEPWARALRPPLAWLYPPPLLLALLAGRPLALPP
eukprot:tig00020849_g14663.t1